MTAAKTNGGSSWSSVQAKIEKAQKIKGLLNVSGGAYDHTNDNIQCYKRKTGKKQFVDFLKKRVNRRKV